MTLRELVVSVRDRLSAASLQCADPLLHAKQLIQLALGWDATRLYIEWERECTPEENAKIWHIVERRAEGLPFQYLAGSEGFWKSTFQVGPGVLIPRRETEVLLESALTRLGNEVKVAELGAGTGNIGISFLLERPLAEWHAFELNPASLEYAESNAKRLLAPTAKYRLHAQDFFVGAPKFAPFDAIVANPPYVSSSELEGLSREVKHEPRVALDGGKEGLEIIRNIVEAAPRLLAPGGWLLLEIGSAQGDAVEALFAKSLDEVRLLRDYAALPRVVAGRI